MCECLNLDIGTALTGGQQVV